MQELHQARPEIKLLDYTLFVDPGNLTPVRVSEVCGPASWRITVSQGLLQKTTLCSETGVVSKRQALAILQRFPQK